MKKYIYFFVRNQITKNMHSSNTQKQITYKKYIGTYVIVYVQCTSVEKLLIYRSMVSRIA